MAIAGLHNITVPDSVFLRDSQSQVSRQLINEDKPSTRASSILQMWRDLEDEHVVRHAEEGIRARTRQQRSDGFTDDLSSTSLLESEENEHRSCMMDVGESDNECGTWSGSQMGSPTENEDHGNFGCEQSSDIGEVERERVRQIFQGWMNSGGREHASSVPQRTNGSRAQWLGENECERVRIIREWVQMNSEQRGSCGEIGEDQAAEIGAQIERVRDGLVVDHNEDRSDNIQRRMRRLCGRQALLDMLAKAERERKREIQSLLEFHAVSKFSHRNRIQAFIRGRFLRNQRQIEDQKPTSTAAGELGLLRQRHTVSGLREGFISRFDNCGHGQVSSYHSDTSYNSDTHVHRNEEAQANSSQGTPDEILEQYKPTNEESNNDSLLDDVDDLEVDTVGNISGQELSGHDEVVLENEVRNRQQVASVEFTERRDSTGEDVDGSWIERTAVESGPETSGNEGGEDYHLHENLDVFHDHPEPSDAENDFHGSSELIDDSEVNTVENINWQESASQVEDWHEHATVSGDRDWQQLGSVVFTDWSDGVAEEMNGNWRGSSVNSWSQDMIDDEGRQPSHLPETYATWDEDNSQRGVEDQLGGSSEQEVVPVTTVDNFYLSDDDNVHGVELRELSSRRRVSNLLQSGFRESLDQLIQSYVARQANVPIDWEVDGVSPSPDFANQFQEQQSENQNDGPNAIDSPLVQPLPPVPPQSLWGQHLRQDNWQQHNMHQQLGIEWEIINDLRIDMTRLQQRVNNMQRMLEACMDMQLELQRSIRQEVSAALNRPAGSPELCEDTFLNDRSKWDHVRKGICCMCSDSNIDSLLYRCGHMCTCSKCANNLVEGRGKCPMCHAPVVEVIRAYSIL